MGLRVFFLDFDGVLNSGSWWNTRPHGHLAFDPSLVDLLNKLVTETDARIVFSTSWRHGRTVENLSGMLEGYGCYVMTQYGTDRCIGKTPDQALSREPWDGYSVRTASSRGREIQAWLDENPVESFVILDDDDDMEHLKSFHVMTDPEVGLTLDDVARATKILLGQ